MTIKIKANRHRELPEVPGVYLMRSASGGILYVGKAGNLRRRVSSYFDRPHSKMQMMPLVRTIEARTTRSALEALIVEASLIKKYQPPYNVREKDNKSFLFVSVTRERFPRVLLTRGSGDYGPFVSASQIREALRIVRKIFPYATHTSGACFGEQIGLCPGFSDRRAYLRSIRNIRMIFEGRTDALRQKLEREMHAASRRQEYERAGELKRQVFALTHVRDTALIAREEDHTPRADVRIEGYDISHISGTSAVGSMVVFCDSIPARSEYRRFKIKTVKGSNDTAMLAEVLNRRLNHSWPLPYCVLVDGGAGQVHAMEQALRARGHAIPVIGIAKGPERKRNDVIGAIPEGITKETLIRVRDEAHRFAISYHHALRGKLL